MILLGYLPRPELTTGRRDILAFAVADDDRIVLIVKNFEKAVNRGRIRAFEVAPVVVVERDQVYLCL